VGVLSPEILTCGLNTSVHPGVREPVLLWAVETTTGSLAMARSPTSQTEARPMSPAALSVVADNVPAPQPSEIVKPETVAQHVRRLQAEARALAKDHVHALSAALQEAERLAAEIAEGGDIYPPGVRDLARRMAEEFDGKAQTLEVIVARN
jgi:hypothetical protein